MTAAYGEQITCTITNKRLPQLKVVKDLLPAADAGRFDLKIDATTYTNAGAGYGDGGNTGFVNVTAASHTVDEAGHAGTSLADYDKSVSWRFGQGWEHGRAEPHLDGGLRGADHLHDHEQAAAAAEGGQGSAAGGGCGPV